MAFASQGITAQVVPAGHLRLPASILSIGAFDGVHRGHRTVLQSAIGEAKAQRLPAVVWTFDPPPKVFFERAEPLMVLNDRLARISALGPDYIVLASFTAAYATQSATGFLSDLANVGPRRIHVGANFRFGAGQTGDCGLLARHFSVALHNLVTCAAGEVISSSRIRALRKSGDMAGARAFLHDETASPEYDIV